MKYTKDLDDSKGLAHEVFVTVWEKFGSLPTDTNYKSYLYTAVRNRCLNYLRDKKKNVTLENVPEHEFTEENTSMETEELEKEIELGIALLPDKCRMVFELNRIEGLKYAQIADKMGISIKTVEAQMSKALSVLRTHLREFIAVIFFLIIQ